jgi:flavin-dependent dehydrogenase
MKVDIVGGSLSGLSAAITLKTLDPTIDVVVHEKHKKIGYNYEGRRCGEGHTVESLWKKWKPKGKSIFTEIKTVETILGDKTYIAKPVPGTFYILNRQEFISQLGKQAEQLGAIIHTNDKIKSVSAVDGDFIIDASGCPSTIKKELGIDKGLRGVTYQQTLEDSNYTTFDVLKVFFTHAIGYYWIFPRNPLKNEINVGVGVFSMCSLRLKDMLEAFKREQGVEGTVNYVVGGFVPAGLQKPLRYKNIFFVGDAGVGAFPVLGKGIYRALLSGEMAAKCIATGHPEQYRKEVHRAFLKWDLLGKAYIRVDQVLSKIGEKAVRSFYRWYLDFWYSFH